MVLVKQQNLYGMITSTGQEISQQTEHLNSSVNLDIQGNCYRLVNTTFYMILTLPKYIFGTYFIFIHTDGEDNVYEHFKNDNNVRLSVSLMI